MTDPLQLEITKREKLGNGQTCLHIQPTFRASTYEATRSASIDVEKMQVEKVRCQWGRLIVGPTLNNLYALLGECHALRVRPVDVPQVQIMEQKIGQMINDLSELANGDPSK